MSQDKVNRSNRNSQRVVRNVKLSHYQMICQVQDRPRELIVQRETTVSLKPEVEVNLDIEACCIITAGGHRAFQMHLMTPPF